MRQIPGCHEPKYILLDYLHIFHLGYGIDAGASSITLLCHLGYFGPGPSLDTKLAEAYRRFDLWCKTKRRTTSIDEFSKQSFGMGTCLNFKNGVLPMGVPPKRQTWTPFSIHRYLHDF